MVGDGGGTDPSLRSALGNVAVGDRFWDRHQETEELLSYLREGTSLLLVGPRRIGKTSIVRRVLARSRDTVIFVDAQAATSPEEFFAELVAAAAEDASTRERLAARFRRVFERIEGVEVATVKIEFAAELADSWFDRAKDVLRALAGHDGATVLAIDELPILLDRLLRRGSDDVAALLSLLRWAVDDLQLRVLVSGSIGLEPILHRVGMTGQATFLLRYEIGPWDKATTTEAIDALARGSGLTFEPGAAETVHAKLGSGVPYHVQLYADAIRLDAVRRAVTHVTARDVTRVYEERLLGSVSAHMLHLESRLRDVLGEGDELRLAFDLLTEAAVQGRLTTAAAGMLAQDVVEDPDVRSSALRDVLLILEHDAYLRSAAQEYRFTSRLVSDWWKQRNGYGYVPARDRLQP